MSTPCRFLIIIGCVGGVLLWILSNSIGNFQQCSVKKTERSIPTKVEPSKGQAGTVASFAELPRDRESSSDPVEHAVACGTVLDSRVLTAESGCWKRERLVQTRVQPRPVRVVEKWMESPVKGWVCRERYMYLADQLIVKKRQGVRTETLQKRLQSLGWAVGQSVSDQWFSVLLPEATLNAVPQALAVLVARHQDLVESSEADGVGFAAEMPNDALFSQQWGNYNPGVISGSSASSDVGATAFWDILQTASGVTIAVLDSGLYSKHPDLENVAWKNTGEEEKDNIDNDGNGKKDDVVGWDFVDNDNDPTDLNYHGTHVTGIIAANRNNGIGIAGMVDGVKIMTCKVLNNAGSGTTLHLLAAVRYAREMGVPVMNLSLQSYPPSSELSNEFTLCENAGILLCIAAGNGFQDNDLVPNYPSSYPHDCILAVSAHDESDGRLAFANYGMLSVDLFAPGSSIVSTALANQYRTESGTSAATPYVTAVAAAIKSLNPSWRAAAIKNSILSSAERRAKYHLFCRTGGRLNALSALAYAICSAPSADADQDSFSNLFEYLSGTRVDSGQSRPQIWKTATDGVFRVGLMQVARPEAFLMIERSDDLVCWRSDGIVKVTQPDFLQGQIPISGERGKFLRIREVSSMVLQEP